MATENPRPDDDSLDAALREFLDELDAADTQQLEAMTSADADRALESRR